MSCHSENLRIPIEVHNESGFTWGRSQEIRFQDYLFCLSSFFDISPADAFDRWEVILKNEIKDSEVGHVIPSPGSYSGVTIPGEQLIMIAVTKDMVGSDGIMIEKTALPYELLNVLLSQHVPIAVYVAERHVTVQQLVSLGFAVNEKQAGLQKKLRDVYDSILGEGGCWK